MRAFELTTSAVRARACLAKVRPSDYARTRDDLRGAVTGLSPFITHGVLTLPQVYDHLVQHVQLTPGHKLVYELGWREYFRHVWAHRGEGIFESLHDGPLPESAYDRELPSDLRAACTGVPVIDQAVRTLYATGYLHNHARMWLASYAVHLRRVHWRAGADWMVAHLLDGDLASNHLSWQWVAGTGSHKPYLFNAENVARYAPAAWHSPGTVVDQSYETLERIARGGDLPAQEVDARVAASSCVEPLLHDTPASELGVKPARLLDARQLVGRSVWLVHPWALRAPPDNLPANTLVAGVYLRGFHQRWPWSQARWAWVDSAMAEITQERWWLDAGELRALLSQAASVRSLDDPHIGPELRALARLDAPARLFSQVDRPCGSFSKWWSIASASVWEREKR